ncbi:MAG: hypothetical protein OXM56_12220 [Gammaproteobacteria bacterium]|nr:hypothetical protein [Gammaproteobacteria bacterium]
MEKYPFCSAAWVGVARDFIETQCAENNLSGIETSFCEKFTDTPDNVTTDGDGVTGWYFRIAGGKVEVGHGVIEDADATIIADYQTVVPLARVVFEGNPEGAADAQRVVEQATAEGKMRREGSEDAMNATPFLAGLHDVLARRTA